MQHTTKWSPKVQEAIQREVDARRDPAKALHLWPCLCDDCALPTGDEAKLRAELEALRGLIDRNCDPVDATLEDGAAIARIQEQLHPDRR